MHWLLLILAITFVFYVYVGYPLILFLIRKYKDVQIPSQEYVGDISIVMVVCNEQQRVNEKIKNLLALNHSGGRKKIIVVDDASTDNTLDILNQYSNEITIISSPRRLGKANGLNLAMELVDTELALMVDCRQEIELDVIQYLSSWFVNNDNMGAVSGELLFKQDGENEFSQGMDGYWKYEKFIRQSEAIISSVPGVSGALYMLRSSAFRPLPIDTLLDDVQIPMVCASQGYKVGFDDRAIAWDEPSSSYEKEKSRKIRTLSGNYQLLLRFPMWVLPMGHPIWWQFFSHKIARLVAPFFALASFIPAYILMKNGSELALIYIVLFSLGLLIWPVSLLLPKVNSIKPIKLLTSFLSLNWFCILAFYHFFFVSQSGSWKK